MSSAALSAVLHFGVSPAFTPKQAVISVSTSPGWYIKTGMPSGLSSMDMLRAYMFSADFDPL